MIDDLTTCKEFRKPNTVNLMSICLKGFRRNASEALATEMINLWRWFT